MTTIISEGGGILQGLTKWDAPSYGSMPPSHGSQDHGRQHIPTVFEGRLVPNPDFTGW